MRREYITEIVLTHVATQANEIVIKLFVNRESATPFYFAVRQHGFMQSSSNYYSLGKASQQMLAKARRLERLGYVISSVSYTQTSIIVKDLPDFYKIDEKGKVTQIR